MLHFSICLLVDGHLGCFPVVAVVSNAAVNVGVQISRGDNGFVFFGYLSENGMGGSYSSILRLL